ncbi:octapeptide-repeat protein T2-like [Kogia breviceps]|uniref:octapeptide-repeat protein T2-like n=1 Tax=Kogia breviceps TaxID=27615 RepID=UPI0034D236B0
MPTNTVGVGPKRSGDRTGTRETEAESERGREMGREESERHRPTLLNGESSPGRQRQRKSESDRETFMPSQRKPGGDENDGEPGRWTHGNRPDPGPELRGAARQSRTRTWARAERGGERRRPRREPESAERGAPRPGETKPAGGSHRDRPRPCHRVRAAETETSGGESARRAQRGQRAQGVEPLAGREALRPRAETPRALEREAEPEAGGETSGGELKSPEGKRAEPGPGRREGARRRPRPARRPPGGSWEQQRPASRQREPRTAWPRRRRCRR